MNWCKYKFEFSLLPKMLLHDIGKINGTVSSNKQQVCDTKKALSAVSEGAIRVDIKNLGK